jgi:hypothetical protein
LRIAYLPQTPSPVLVRTMKDHLFMSDDLYASVNWMEKKSMEQRGQPALMLEPLIPSDMERELLTSVERIVIEDVSETEHEF